VRGVLEASSLSRRRAVRRRRITALVVVVAGLAAALIVLRATVLAPVDTQGAVVRHLTIHSEAVGGDLGLNVVVPARAVDRPALVLFLHGRSGDQGSYTGEDALFAALAKLGRRAPAVAFPDGGQDSYWHDRADGDWDRYLVKEVLPAALRASGANPHRVAVGGISMGGFGAFDLALHHPGRFCAIGGHSPALWQSGGETAPGAFDDAEDFARNDVVGAARSASSAYLGVPIWIDRGDEDPFGPGDAMMVSALRAEGADVTSHVWPGGHEIGYWDSHWADYFRWYARQLRHCG
jgi:S-formylglutathione hydrolase FrmB